MLKKRQNSILDLYFQLFLDELNSLVRQGLLKQYRQSEGNLSALKGRLVFSQHLRYNLIHKENFYTAHQIYNYDNIYNQILSKALNVLLSINYNPYIVEQINRLKLLLPLVSDVFPTEKDFDKLHWHRKTETYKKAIQIAKLIILNYFPDIRTGKEDILAILFDMNKLWEEYVYRLLLRSTNQRYVISYQNSKPFWEHKTIRPDIVIRSLEDNITYIVDTKWKLIDSLYPADDDLKQAYAYNMYWDTPKCLLLYPSTFDNQNQKDIIGKFHKGRAYEEHNECHIAFLNILSAEMKLDLSAGLKVLDKLPVVM
jgi:5-methylcytosine-specific restriction enzyme subunit McrC